MSQELRKLLRIMNRLRSPNGCPWDQEQTHRSLVKCLKDECLEVIECIESGDHHGLREELGDLLLQVVFHSQLAREKGRFTFNDVVKTLNRKLIRRHPHVFGDAEKIKDSETLMKRWKEIKIREKQDRRHARNRISRTRRTR